MELSPSTSVVLLNKKKSEEEIHNIYMLSPAAQTCSAHNHG
jgi:hypothetical protein